MTFYRLGLDLGSNSIGWCAVALELLDDPKTPNIRYRPIGVMDVGVRILTPNEEAGRDPHSKSSLAASRRAARAARRRRDRFLQRQKRLMQTLVSLDLMPKDVAKRKDLEKLDPYWLRAKAVDEKLDRYEIGRAIFHLNQRRGFKSNRIADSDDSEKSATKDGMRALNDALTEFGAKTLGQFLAKRHKRDKRGNRLQDGKRYAEPEPVRFRPTAQGAKNLYALYPSRDLIEAELETIWTKQATYHPDLSDEALKRLKRIIVEQRPLKKPSVGRCTLRPEAAVERKYGLDIDIGERAPKAHPLFQRFRILQDASQLRVMRPGRSERPLTLTERDAIVAKLMANSGNTVTFERLRKAIKLPDDARFNYELSGRKGLPPDQTAAKLGMKKAFGKRWRSLSRERQIEVVERLLKVEEPDVLIKWLCETFDLDEATAETISDTRLPQGHGRFGRSILSDLVEVMETKSREAVDSTTGEVYAQPLTYDEAVRELDGLHHSDIGAGGTANRLPYYGEALVRHVISKPDAPDGSQERIGRVPNPTVHIALNQLRQIVNALIDKHGKPSEVVIELGRELKLNRQRKDQIRRENQENEKKNEDRRERLVKLGQADTYEARLRLRLFDELPADERVCVFTGEPLSLEMLFNGSLEIEHILPYSQTLDDSFMNKVLCKQHANREKGRQAPAEVSAWRGERLQEIVERAERLFPKKAWRFQPDAMQRFEADGGFLARQLTDTQHMSRLAKTYVEHVCDQVWASPGRLTAMLRARWGLNALLPDHNYADTAQPKNRKDHRHHAIDAFVVACTDRGLLNRIARASARAESDNPERLFPKGEFPEPFDGFREALGVCLEEIIVSHKPDHGIPPGAQENVHVTSGQLHEATAYGLVDEEIDGKLYNLVTRKPVEQLTKREIGCIRDRHLREALLERMPADDKKLREMLAQFADERGVKRVRILKTEGSVRPVLHMDSTGSTFEKAYTPGDNHRVEIYTDADDAWNGEGVTVHDANQRGYKPKWRREHPNARLVMRLHRGDMIEADFGEGRKIYRVYRIEPSAKRVRLAAHNEAGRIDDRDRDDDDPLRWIFGTYKRLRQANACRVRVDPLGRVTRVAEERG